ncbi:UbiA-like polyprenyltransferase [Caldalkalibacillus mannanilyticus]|uniref:UbiA-like polyprenyltransferase n=1 Tax=Caldalkalibacillus mannanilyticus TaxID=1418 RepID=UPI000554BC4A
MIKFEHTIFALPFAFFGAFLGLQMEIYTIKQAYDSEHVLIWQPHLSLAWASVWILLAMVGARSAAMALNRVIDRYIDAKNPRTSTRAIPAGLLSAKEVYLFIIGSFALLFVSAYMLNMLAVKLLPIAVFFLVFYSYTKRFTWTCHLFLGVAIGLAPLGGWVGTTGTLHIESILLFLAVALWTAGFDIIYATQDVQFDQKEKLFSIPSRFGVAKALVISRALHVLTVVLFYSLFFVTPLGWIYLIGCTIATGILIYEHTLVKHDDLSKVDMAFFTMNGIMSVIISVSAIGDLVILS